MALLLRDSWKTPVALPFLSSSDHVSFPREFISFVNFSTSTDDQRSTGVAWPEVGGGAEGGGGGGGGVDVGGGDAVRVSGDEGAAEAPSPSSRRSRAQLRARVSVAAATQTSLRVRGESLPSELVASPSELLASHSELTGAGGAGESLGFAKLMERCSDGVEDQGAEERYEFKNRLMFTCCTTSQVYDTLSFGKRPKQGSLP
jgi:hypothetical protein